MRMAVVDAGGLVVNVIMAEPEDQGPDNMVLVASETANPGDTFVDAVLVPQPVVPAAPTQQDVTRVRDTRIAAGFVFQAKAYDSRPEDQKRINGAAMMAFMAMVGGAQAGNYRWHGGAADFAWIAQDNSLTIMDAQTMVAFGQAAAQWETANIFAARALKDMAEIPADYATGPWWP